MHSRRKRGIAYSFDFHCSDVLDKAKNMYTATLASKLYELGIPIIAVLPMPEYNVMYIYPVSYHEYFQKFSKIANRLRIDREIESNRILFSICYELEHLNVVTDEIMEIDSIKVPEDKMKQSDSLDDFFRMLKESGVITL